MGLFVAEDAPHGAGEWGMVESDLTQHAVVSGARGAHSAILGDVLRAKGQNDELVDTRKVFHELPRVFAAAQPLVDEDGELVGGLSA